MKNPEQWLKEYAGEDFDDFQVYFNRYLKEFLEYSMQQIKEKLDADIEILSDELADWNPKEGIDYEVYIISGKVDGIKEQILKDLGI